jgi:hypothetical protein
MRQTALVPQLTYRLYREEDIPGLLRLWEENTEWGRLTPEQWREWYVDTPHGPCLIPVAIDETGTARGQLVLTPARLAFGDQELKALRLSAPILQKQLRAIQRPHPTLCLYERAVEAAIAQGYGLFYAYPDRRALHFFRRHMDVRFVELKCVALVLGSREFQSESNLLVTRETSFGEEYQQLWIESRKRFPISLGIARSCQWLKYRNGAQLMLGVRSASGGLVGYLALNTRTELITDCLARTPEDLVRVLSASIRWLGSQVNKPAKIKAMASPTMRAALDAVGFIPEHFTFLFAYSGVDPKLPLESFDLNSWHLMPGD